VTVALLTLLAYLWVGTAVPEPTPKQERPPATGPQDVREAFAIPGYRELFGLFPAITIGIMIVNSRPRFYLESALRIPGAQQTPVLGLLFATAVATFPSWNRLCERIGKRDALTLGLVAALFTFGQKLAGSVGVFANAIAAAWFGYVAGATPRAGRAL